MKVETAIGGYVIQTFDPGILVKSVLIAFRNTPSDLSNDIMRSYQLRRIWREGLSGTKISFLFVWSSKEFTYKTNLML